MQRRLAEFTVRAAKVGRSVFRGNLGYAAAQSIDAREFISADAPHRPDEPRLDLDMASYALTKVIRVRRPDDPASGRHWEPKEAFRAVGPPEWGGGPPPTQSPERGGGGP